MDMTINKESNGSEVTLQVSGRLNTLTAPSLEKELEESLPNVTKLTLDFQNLEYISSAGLRLLLVAHKKMNGNLVIKNLNDSVKEVLGMTGFLDIITVE